MAALSLVLLSLGALPLGCGGGPSRTEEAGRPRTQAEQKRPETRPATNPERGADAAWTAAVARDASPSLAAPGETMGFGHQIALTFDDGPAPETTPAVLDVLRAHKVKATFFVVGARAEQYPDLVRRIVREGHVLGNHTYDHQDVAALPPGAMPEAMKREIRGAQAAIDRTLGTGHRVTLYRPACGAPYQTETDRLPAFRQVMREQKMYPVMWSIDPQDWSLGDRPDLVAYNVAQDTPEDGGVLLLHDTQPQTAAALPEILDRYASEGFEFTGVRDLLAEKYGTNPDGIEDGSYAPSRRGAPPKPNPAARNALSSADCLTF